jgi:hypothetical protein
VQWVGFIEIIRVQDSEVSKESNLRVRGVNKSTRTILYFYLLNHENVLYMSEYLFLTWEEYQFSRVWKYLHIIYVSHMMKVPRFSLVSHRSTSILLLLVKIMLLLFLWNESDQMLPFSGIEVAKCCRFSGMEVAKWPTVRFRKNKDVNLKEIPNKPIVLVGIVSAEVEDTAHYATTTMDE